MFRFQVLFFVWLPNLSKTFDTEFYTLIPHRSIEIFHEERLLLAQYSSSNLFPHHFQHIDTHRHRHTHTISSDFIFILSTGLQALCKNFPSCVLKTRSGFWSSLSQLSLVFYISWQKFETGCQFVFEKQLFKAMKIPPISKMPSMIDSFFFFLVSFHHD